MSLAADKAPRTTLPLTPSSPPPLITCIASICLSSGRVVSGSLAVSSWWRISAAWQRLSRSTRS